MTDGLHEDEIEPYLLKMGWFNDFSIHSFYIEPTSFVHTLIEELIRL